MIVKAAGWVVCRPPVTQTEGGLPSSRVEHGQQRRGVASVSQRGVWQAVRPGRRVTATPLSPLQS